MLLIHRLQLRLQRYQRSLVSLDRRLIVLNDRRDDIPLLVDFFSAKIASEQGTLKKHFSVAALKLLKGYNWTGNIRELRNVVERLIILGSNEISENDVRTFASKL